MKRKLPSFIKKLKTDARANTFKIIMYMKMFKIYE
jgi:hypothetical protein